MEERRTTQTRYETDQGLRERAQAVVRRLLQLVESGEC